MKTILVVDDDPDIVDALELVLTDEGYNVQTATKYGNSLLSKVEAEKPDLIILDVLLSGYDGRDICKKLKTQEHTRRIPILMFSAHPDAEDSALAAGADVYMPKPFDIDQLLSSVEQCVHT